MCNCNRWQVVKVIWHKTASPPRTDGSIVFARWHQCAVPCGHIGTTWRIRLHVCFLWPTRVHNPNGKWIGSAVSAQLTAESPYTIQWATLSPKILPFHGGSEPSSNSWFLGPVRAHSPNSITVGSAISTQVTAECPYTLQWATPSCSKLPLPMGDLDPTLIHGSLGSLESSTQAAPRSV